MCGIAGILDRGASPAELDRRIGRMLAPLRHRGPEDSGRLVHPPVALGHARLSIVDLAGGHQPIANEDEHLWVVVNGEIFNHLELRRDLEDRGHRFRTRSDSEVLLHLYEEHGPDLLAALNGQFAVALWDARARRLLLARDRLGVRPLFFAESSGVFAFASEIKGLLTEPWVSAELDPRGLHDVLTYWAPLPGHTVFRGIEEVPPGHWMSIEPGGPLHRQRYWSLDFPPAHAFGPADEDDAALGLRERLSTAIRLRLRADVPVGAYLSGGLDSSSVTALARQLGTSALETFSIAFADDRFDERGHQTRMARFLGTRHHLLEVTHQDIGRAFPHVVRHTETPLLRTAPVPMFLLARHVHDHGLKVVLTGEGADEFLGGYDLFKEDAVRRFWARQPDSTWRPRLLTRLYRDVFGDNPPQAAMLAGFFRPNLTDTGSPWYSHGLRWRNARRLRRFLLPSWRLDRDPADDLAHLVPPGLLQWEPLARAQHWEITTFLSTYLLPLQADRVAMAHAVESRYPFLDPQVVAFCNQLPARLKLRGLREKRVLRRAVADLLPADILHRPKRPYRAPIHRSFFAEPAPDYVRALLDPAALRKTGVFDPVAVTQLVTRAASSPELGETDSMALTAILSTQLWWHTFVAKGSPP